MSFSQPSTINSQPALNTGTKWTFTEGKNPYNTASHCDIAWAGALSSEVHAQKRSVAWAMVG
jgi:hypothetical protein